jgi:predicted Zn-dependent protease
MKNQIIKFKSILIVFMFAFAGFSINGCGDNGINIYDINLFSASDDVKLGAEVDGQIRANTTEYPIYNNALATTYVQNIVNSILNSPLIEYKNTFVYKVTLLNSTTINAFCTPGGYIYVYTGLLKYLDNEATLAAILAHEMAHAERRHATKRMTKQYGVTILLNIILGQNPSELAQIGTNLFTGLGLLYNSREDEYEADEYSFKYLQSTQWYPGAGKYFFEKIKSDQNQSALEELFSTHPLDDKRIAALDQFIKDAGLGLPNESNLFTSRYLTFKSTLQ